jgi:hypothetical protein
VTALLTFFTLGTPLALGGEGASHVLSGKIGREYFERATGDRIDLMLHPLAFALPAIVTLLLLWAT